MPTEAQIKANRANSQGAGVKTEEGKRISRHNSFKHGMTAETLLDSVRGLSESETQYLAVVEGLRQSLGPKNYFEETLIEGMAKAQFKLRRFDLLEATYIRDCESPFGDALNFQQLLVSDDRFSLALKYKQSLEAQYFRALEYLIRARQAEKQLDLFLPAKGAE